MARKLTDEEIAKLLAMPEKEASKWIDDNIPGLLDSVEAKRALIQRRQYSADNPIPGFDSSAVVGLSIGAGVSAVAAARLAELVKGSTQTYKAILNSGELRSRLRTVLGQEFGLSSSGQFVSVTRDEVSFCQIRLAVSESERQTAVTISGLNLDEIKEGAGDVVDDLMGLGKKALSGHNVVEGVLDVLGEAVSTAGQAGSDLMAANTIADTIEKYGAEVERQAAEVARKVAVERAEAEERKRKEKYCSYCGSARTFGQPCPSCGATETE